MSDEILFSAHFGPEARELFHLTSAGTVVLAKDATAGEIAMAWCQSLLQPQQQQGVAYLVARWEQGPHLAKLLTKVGETIARVDRTATGFDVSFLIRVGEKCVALTFPAVVGDPVGDLAQPEAWGLTQLGPGVWAVSPSFWARGVVVQKDGAPPADLHTYITITGVPEGALGELQPAAEERLLT